MKSRLRGYEIPKIEGTMFSLVTVAALFLVCLPPEAVSQQCRSGVTDEIRQSVREQLRQGEENGTIPTVAVNCGQVCFGCKMWLGVLHSTVCVECLLYSCSAACSGVFGYKVCLESCIVKCGWEMCHIFM